MCHSPSPSCVTCFAVMCHFSVFAVMSSPPSSPSRVPPTCRCACLSPAICQVSLMLPLSALPTVAIICPLLLSPINWPPTPSLATGNPHHPSTQPFTVAIYQIFPTLPPFTLPGHSDIHPSCAHHLSTGHPYQPPLPSQNTPVIVLHTPSAATACCTDPLCLKFSVNYLHVR